MKQNAESANRSKNFISIKDNQMISIKENKVVHLSPRNVFDQVQHRSPRAELSMINHSTSMPGSESLPRSSVNQDLSLSNNTGYTSPNNTGLAV